MAGFCSGPGNPWLGAGALAQLPCTPLPPVDMPFQEYVEHLLEPQDLDLLGSGE